MKLELLDEMVVSTSYRSAGFKRVTTNESSKQIVNNGDNHSALQICFSYFNL